MRETSIALVLATSVLFGAATQPLPESRAESKRLRMAGLAAGYNLDYSEALEAFRGREAVRLGKANHDSGSSDEAATLLKTAYRRAAEVTNVRQ
jgi:hypothetical protein